MLPFSLLIKPVSYHCNLRCNYCFYLIKEELFGKEFHCMDLATFEAMVLNYYSCDIPTYSFAFQGGEPMLAGLEFYKQVVKIQQKHLPKGKSFSNAIQTNGTLITEEFAKFLKENNFLVGISIDGESHLHNKYRCNSSGQGSYDAVIAGLEQLKKHQVEFNTLTLVSESNVKHPEEVYLHMCKLGSVYHQYIECIEADNQYALKPGEWGEFMCRLFDIWYKNDTHKISIRLFDSIISRLVTGYPNLCSMGGSCCNYFVVEHDGGIYPCDFFVRAETKLGNVLNNRFEKLSESTEYNAFGSKKEPKNDRCMSCKYLMLCMGDCPKNRVDGRISSLCKDWQIFYQHTADKFIQLAQSLQRQQR